MMELNEAFHRPSSSPPPGSRAVDKQDANDINFWQCRMQCSSLGKRTVLTQNVYLPAPPGSASVSLGGLPT